MCNSFISYISILECRSRNKSICKSLSNTFLKPNPYEACWRPNIEVPLQSRVIVCWHVPPLTRTLWFILESFVKELDVICELINNKIVGLGHLMSSNAVKCTYCYFFFSYFLFLGGVIKKMNGK